AMPAVSPSAAAAAAAAASAAAADIEPTVPVVRPPAATPAPLPQRPQRADGRIAGWDAPSDPDAIGAGVSRRQPTPGPPPQQPLPTQMQRQLDQLHAERQPPQQPQQGGHQRLSAYPPQPQFSPQGYQQQPGPQGYQQPAPGQPYQGPGGRYPEQQRHDRYQDRYQDQYPDQHQERGGYQPSQFQASAAAPPRPVAYTPNQQPVMPRQPPPRERDRERDRDRGRDREPARPPVQKTVVKRRRGMPLGCLVKLMILGLIGFGIYTGVNWTMAKINGASRDLNYWISREWHQIAQKVNVEKKKLPPALQPSDLPTSAPVTIPGGGGKTS
ncbi:MAG: hypothetical protein HOV87_18190, partial [Catenulispora sp.]|nr:hypothetical protein [Catenulispora sp.]